MSETGHDGLREELERREQAAQLGGGAARIERQHAAGKLTARERLELLFDPGSFCEIDAFVTHRCADFGLQDNKPLGDGVVTGYGRIDGRVVFAYAQVLRCLVARFRAHAQKICKVMDRAMEGRAGDRVSRSGGAHQSVDYAGYADIFLRNTLASGVVPQITVVLGLRRRRGHSPAITDFIGWSISGLCLLPALVSRRFS